MTKPVSTIRLFLSFAALCCLVGCPALNSTYREVTACYSGVEATSHYHRPDVESIHCISIDFKKETTFKIFAYEEGYEDIQLTSLDLEGLKAWSQKHDRKIDIHEDSVERVYGIRLNNMSIRFDWDGKIKSLFSSTSNGGMRARLKFTSDNGSVKWPCFKASLDNILGKPTEVKESVGKVQGP